MTKIKKVWFWAYADLNGRPCLDKEKVVPFKEYQKRIAELEKYKQAVEDAMKEMVANDHDDHDYRILKRYLSQLKEEPKP